MLCKTTMRAALAHVIGMIVVLGAFGAKAEQEDPFAAESFGDAPYTVKGSPVGTIVLDVELDSLIQDGEHFIAVNFWTAQLTAAIPLTYTPDGDDPDVAGTAGDLSADPVVDAVQPMIGSGTGFRFYSHAISTSTSADGTVTGAAGAFTDLTGITLARARDGDPDDSSGVYQMTVASDIALPTVTTTKNRVRIDLTEMLKVPNTDAGAYRGDLYIYDNLGDARLAAAASHPDDVPDTYLIAGYSPLFSVANKIAAPEVTGYLATADVGYERVVGEDGVPGGPFRGFTDDGESGDPDVGTLAMITMGVADGDFLDASTGEAFTGNVNDGAMVSVTSAAGNFGFGTGAGDGPNGEYDDPATMDMVEGGRADGLQDFHGRRRLLGDGSDVDG